MQEKYLNSLAKDFPSRHAVSAELIRLSAELNLPKGTEHFMSDIHGEHEAFLHVRKSASGVIRRKVEQLFEGEMSREEIAELATIIYYPEEKLEELRPKISDTEKWYYLTLTRLISVLRMVSGKYSKEKVSGVLTRAAGCYAQTLDELISLDGGNLYKKNYSENILTTIVRLGEAESFISAISSAIRRFSVERLHIVGDIFDRGARADIVMDELIAEESVDIQWGNHDVLWLAAAAGSRTAIATVLNNSITYRNLDVIEIGYGISLRPLALFAEEAYGSSDVSAFMPKGESGGSLLRSDDDILIAKMHKAISIIQFKLEGQTIKRNPEFLMDDRLLLEKVDYSRGTVEIGGRDYELRDTDFPTVNPANPCELTEREREVMAHLKLSFMRSEKLARHAKFLYKCGEMYTIFNRNLLFHGAIPLDKDNQLMKLAAADGLSGRALMDFCDARARQGYFEKEGSEMRQRGKDFLWFLWCGKNSPLCAREKIASFERLLVKDKRTWDEPKNAYYRAWDDEKIADMILAEFSLGGAGSHIINGHIPLSRGEAPIKAGGQLIVIDGGFCRAFIERTGIGGYTLIYNADGMKISAHAPFEGKESAVKSNADIIYDTMVFEHAHDKMRKRETDEGAVIREKISDLMLLLKAYEKGEIKENPDF